MSITKKRPTGHQPVGQLTFFGAASTEQTSDHSTTPPPSVCSSPTSRAAASRIRPDISRLGWLVLETLQRASPDGLTDSEIQQMLGLAGSSERPRRVWLARSGWVVDSGLRRPSPTGRQCVVWIVTRPAASGAAP